MLHVIKYLKLKQKYICSIASYGKISSRYFKIQRVLYIFSCINPILYAFLSDNFRKAFHLLMPCFVNISGPTHPGHHALRYELTTMKSSTRCRNSREERRRRPQKSRTSVSEKGQISTDDLQTLHRSTDDYEQRRQEL